MLIRFTGYKVQRGSWFEVGRVSPEPNSSELRLSLAIGFSSLGSRSERS